MTDSSEPLLADPPADSARPSGSAPAPHTTAKLAIAVGLLLAPLGRFVPMPGLDHEMLGQLLGSTGPVLGAIGGTVPWLVTVRFLMRHRRSVSTHRIAFVAYLAVVAFQGLGLAYWFENLWTNEFFVGSQSEMNVGLSFRALFILSWCAGAAIVWLCANWIERRTAANGSLVLLLGYTLGEYLGFGFSLGAGFGSGRVDGLELLPWFVLPTLLVVVGFSLWRRSPSYPVALGALSVGSSWDLLALVAVGTVPSGILRTAMTALGAGPSPWVIWLEVAAAIFATIVILGRMPRGQEGERSVAPSLFSLLASAAFLCLFVAGFWGSGGLRRWTGPLEGHGAFRLVIAADERFLDEDASAMLRRLLALGAEAELASANDSRIVLDIRGASSRNDVMQALSPNRMTVHAARPLTEEVAEIYGARVDAYGGIEARCVDLHRFIESAPSTRTEDGAQYLVQETADGCVLHAVAPPVLDSDQVADARVVVDAYTGAPNVQVDFTERGRQEFAEFTAENVHKRIVIALDGVVSSAPVVMESITGGRVALTAQDERDAAFVAASLKPEQRFSRSWHVPEDASIRD